MKYFKGDPVIWAVILLLSVYSLLAVYSSTGTLAYKYQGGNTLYYLLKHASMIFFGIALILVTHRIHYKYYSVFAPILLVCAVFLLILTIFKGVTVNEASRWLTIPGIGLRFQTSDFAKLALIMFIARTLSRKQENEQDSKRSFYVLVASILTVCVLVGKENLSTAILIFITSLVILFVGRVKAKYLLGFIGISIVAMILAGLIITSMPEKGRFGTWSNRIENFFNNEEGDGNYQSEQSKIAISTGGFFGKLPGNSTQKNYLPYAYSDFIFAIIIEEYGLIFGAIPLLFLYLFLLYRTGVILRKSTRTFPAYLAMGITISIVFQALINMAVAVNILPVTGQTLPLVSMGGTSIIITCISIGIVLNISRISQNNKDGFTTEE
ncbi:FtsW/RodA/SpoVE family cell cycle protein [Bacteroidota bacterium]